MLWCLPGPGAHLNLGIWMTVLKFLSPSLVRTCSWNHHGSRLNRIALVGFSRSNHHSRPDSSRGPAVLLGSTWTSWHFGADAMNSHEQRVLNEEIVRMYFGHVRTPTYLLPGLRPSRTEELHWEFTQQHIAIARTSYLLLSLQFSLGKCILLIFVSLVVHRQDFSLGIEKQVSPIKGPISFFSRHTTGTVTPGATPSDTIAAGSVAPLGTTVKEMRPLLRSFRVVGLRLKNASEKWHWIGPKKFISESVSVSLLSLGQTRAAMAHKPILCNISCCTNWRSCLLHRRILPKTSGRQHGKQSNKTPTWNIHRWSKLPKKSWNTHGYWDYIQLHQSKGRSKLLTQISDWFL